ncbi:helix-turn-helix transcriptional regulator [Actinomadura sp. 7K507]|uniref:helix-turn-helix transcriptional regulator n=1 Tax=Actinomadura sp. 7K507 TaxID=2530365 RepID=UPI00104DD888|nr:helix-turn-helix transcriptional regulator [Actinomadura sp. 7K507]TDC86029.1 AraC family transcriptional regulator [Actinomadura sp. 7K507]
MIIRRTRPVDQLPLPVVTGSRVVPALLETTALEGIGGGSACAADRVANVVDVARAGAEGAASLVPVWEMSSMRHVRLSAGMALSAPPDSWWGLVLAGEVTLGAASASSLLAEGDAVLVDARVAYRVTASTEPSTLVVGDFRLAVPAHRLPSPLIVRGFGTRHDGVAALVGKCPLERMGRPSLFAASYGNLIGAAMTASWLEEQDRDTARPDEAVAAVVAAVTARPGEQWTVQGMARLVHLSRSALGERFRRALGRGPAEVLREVRMREARRLLDDPSRPVEYVAFAVGYGSAAAFSRAFSSHHGVAPQAWRDVSSTRDAQDGEDRPGRHGESGAEQEGRRDAVRVQECAS